MIMRLDPGQNKLLDFIRSSDGIGLDGKVRDGAAEGYRIVDLFVVAGLV